MQVIDPTTGEPGEPYEPHDARAIDAKLAAAERAFASWRDAAIETRTDSLRRLAAVLRSKKRAHAELMAHEMGKPVVQGVAEIEKCAAACDHYAEHAAAFLAREIVATDARESFVSHRPLGVVFAIMPWNFPFWQVVRQAAPGLAGGNVIALKHAESVPGCALALEAAFREAGFPDGVFTTLLIDREQAAGVIRDRRVAAVAITGSTRAGKSVAKTAGEVLKKCVLELGGSDPYVVLEDADVALAAETCAKSRLINSGQSCIAAKRFIAVAGIYDAFLARFTERMRAAKVGDPRADETEVGPQARRDLRDELARQTDASVAGGARLVLGGEVPGGRGFFYPPTVLAEVTPGMAAFDEEMFGPVAAVIRADDEAHAIELANRSVYGLGAAVFTRDVARGREIAERRLAAGSCFVNALVKSDPRLPFGGIGESGYGRELGKQGMIELLNTKTVYVG